MAKPKTALPKSSETPGLSLFKIDEEMAVIRILLDESGELTEAEDKYYCQLIDMAKKKCDGYIGTIKYIEGQVEIGKTHIKLMEARLKRWKAISERLRDTLAAFMSNNKIAKLKPDNPVLPCAYLNAGRESVKIDLALLPPEYIVEETIKKPNQEAIAKAAETHAVVPGITYVTGDDFIRLT